MRLPCNQRWRCNMMGGGPRGISVGQEVSKPVDALATLARLMGYFRPYWVVLILVTVLIIGSTWTQVVNPDLTGQAVDCFITPAATSQGGSAGFSIPGQPAASQGQTISTNCWFSALDSKTATTADYVAGLGKLVGLILLIFLAGSVMSGLQFYLIAWAGQHVLMNLRTRVFAHLHQLSLNYYSENEAGNVMSRITNDMDTINQAISFALVNVLSGSLLLVWIAYNMLHKSVAYGLISMLVVPLMILATNWVSGRARKAYRVTRKQIGNVNADLQESISGVREVQAFGREEANIENFKDVNAANRDANITAVSITAVLAP